MSFSDELNAYLSDERAARERLRQEVWSEHKKLKRQVEALEVIESAKVQHTLAGGLPPLRVVKKAYIDFVIASSPTKVEATKTLGVDPATLYRWIKRKL